MAAMRPARPPAAPAAKKAGAAPEAPPPTPPPPAKSRNMTIPAIVLAVAVLGAAFMLKGGGDDGDGTNVAATPTTIAAEHGEVISLEPITLNLAGGDILRVGIALQLAADVPEAAEAAENPAAFGAKALDETIIVLGGYTRTALLADGGIADAKAKLSARVAELYHDAVLSVYFTQLVVA